MKRSRSWRRAQARRVQKNRTKLARAVMTNWGPSQEKWIEEAQVFWTKRRPFGSCGRRNCTCCHFEKIYDVPTRQEMRQEDREKDQN